MSKLRTTTLATVDDSKSIPVLAVIHGAARAWVSFNGMGTVAIIAAFNIASITDNGVGNFVLNIAPGIMPDGSYALAGSGKLQTYGDANAPVVGIRRNSVPTATACNITVCEPTSAGAYDAEIVNAVLFHLG